MTSRQEDRLAPPGSAPTDEDLQHEIELTRKELGDTVAQLMHKLDVKARTREATQRQLTHLHDAAVTTTNRTRNVLRSRPAVLAIAAAALTATLAAVVVLRFRH